METPEGSEETSSPEVRCFSCDGGGRLLRHTVHLTVARTVFEARGLITSDQAPALCVGCGAAYWGVEQLSGTNLPKKRLGQHS